MLKLSRIALVLGLTGAAAGLPSLIAAPQGQDSAGVAEAIRFEKAKQAAADRQARIEEARERGSNTADRMAQEPTDKPKPARHTPPPAHRTAPPRERPPQ